MLLLIGGGGIPNYGDELIIRNWLTWYGSHVAISPKEVAVEGYRIRSLQNTFAGEFPDVRWSQAVRDARLAFRAEGFWGALRGGLESGAERSPKSVSRAFDLARSASVVHIHGGGYINSKWPNHAFVLGLSAAANRSAGVYAVATGLGLAPLPDAGRAERRLLDEVVDAFEFIEVRDAWSFEYLERNVTGDRKDKIVRGLDDAFLYPVTSSPFSPATLHLSLRDDKAGESMIERLSSRFVGSFDRHIFWACKPVDAAAYALLAKRYPFFEIAGVRQLLENPSVSAADVMITERFHPHLQAARAGATGVYWSGSEYYDIKHGSIVELGSPFVADDGGTFSNRSRREPSKIATDDALNVARKRGLAWRASRCLSSTLKGSS